MRTRIILSIIVLLLACTVAVAENITGCLSADDGTLYFVRVADSPSQPCKEGDETLQWAIQGPKGAPGAVIVGEPVYRFVGVTKVTFKGDGDGGYKAAMSAACNAEYPGSRMAFTDEYMLTDHPAPTPKAWIAPRITGPGGVPIRDEFLNFYSRYNCDNFTVAPLSQNAPTVENGNFKGAKCSKEFPVACSAPVTD